MGWVPVGPGLFAASQKQSALNHCVEQITGAKTCGSGCVEYCFDFTSIREADGRSGGVESQLLQQVAGELPGLSDEKLL